MSSNRRVLAVASSGGHWEQLMTIRSALDDAEVLYVCTDVKQGPANGIENIVKISDFNKSDIIGTCRGLFQSFWVVLQFRPQYVVSTGAAPGLVCLLWGRLLGAQTVWIDSIANTEKMSLSGRLALRVAHIVLTQWEHVQENTKGADYWGAVL